MVARRNGFSIPLTSSWPRGPCGLFHGKHRVRYDESDVRSPPPRCQAGGLLPPGSLYAVGGRVRDEIRADVTGPAAKDLDYLVTGVPIEQLLPRPAPLGGSTSSGRRSRCSN